MPSIPAGSTAYTPPPQPLTAGLFDGTSLRHTYRTNGTKDWLLIYTIEGGGFYQHAGGVFHSRAGDCTLYRPEAFQNYQIDPAMKTWNLVFAHFLPRPDWSGLLGWPEEGADFLVLHLKSFATRRRILARLQDMVRFYRGSEPRSQLFAQNAMEEALLWLDSLNPRQAALQGDLRVRKAIDYLRTHLSEPFSEGKLARASGLSASRLRHLFFLETGNSPRRFLEAQRLRRAEELLLLSRHSVAEIARELGYENPFYFSLRFKKHSGESPRHFRQKRIGLTA